MHILQRCLIAAMCGLGLLAVLPAADDPAPDFNQLVVENDTGQNLVHMGINNGAVLWQELGRSNLFKAFGDDANFVSSTKTIWQSLGAKLKSFDDVVPGGGDQVTPAQLGRFGPILTTMDLNVEGDMTTLIRIGHRCDVNYLRSLMATLTRSTDLFMEQLFLRPNVKPNFVIEASMAAYRVKDNWTILQAGNGVHLLMNPSRLLVTGGSVPEAKLLARQKEAHAAKPSPFLDFLKADSPWLTAFSIDFNLIEKLAGGDHREWSPKNPDVFGSKGISGIVAREFVNRDGRFEGIARAGGKNLDKLFFFAGAAKPINANIARAVPENAALGLYLNLDLGAIQGLKAEDLAGHSKDYQDFAKELQDGLKREFSTGNQGMQAGMGGDAKPPVMPELDRGFLFTLFDPDQIEQIENSIVVTWGIKPGFKPTEDWARAVLNAPKDDNPVPDEGGDRGSQFKAVEYSGATIYVAKRWRTECVAITDTAYIWGTELKYIKQTIRALQNAAKNEAEKNQFKEWDMVQTLVPKDGKSALVGFGYVRTPSIVRKYGTMAMGGLSLVFPKIATDVDWTKVSDKLQPSIGALTYNAEQGFEARTLSDIPVASSALFVATMAKITELRYEGGYYHQDRPDPDDLPPPGGWGEGDLGGGPVPMPVPLPDAPATETLPDPAPAPAPAPAVP